ncbi:MAG TPA: Asp-tRNA(Asn)/Glu-tRNA(Gln) amidotransferase subunit GatA, partial [Tepidisphaeraceae bacterium]|nr:Asp-tRNA(Asn)/Glu-tRNA(Gln) amidotransferase subunit GatA [Tepidisphaeraceae bacterium]
MVGARDAVAEKKTSSVELTKFVLDRIAKLDPTLRAFVTTYPERALKIAAEVDAGQRTGALAGVPIAIKDNLCTTFGTTTCSSRMLQNFRAPYDATVVQELEAAGAVIVGKTNLDEFAMGSSTENSALMVTKNPWDTNCIPGGSSGGAASAVAGQLAYASLGSDTGGSIRQPASMCGIVGLKPTYGRVSRYGLVAFASSLDQIGPLTFDVADTALLMNVISGHDGLDSTSAQIKVPDYLSQLEQPLTGLRIGIAKEYDLKEGLDPEVKKAVDQSIEVYKSLGATVVDVTLPHTKYGIAAYYVIAPCEASSNLARYDGVHYGHRTKEPVKDIIELFSKSRYEGFGDEVKRRIMIGTYALSSGYYDAYYNRALKIRTLIKQDFDRAFEQCDVVLCPTSPTLAFKPGDKSDPLAMYLCDVFTVTCNIAGIAGVSIPCGFSSSAKPLPIGLQLLGPAFSEEKLLRAARMHEKATSWH